ncbi:MAG: hypothetical protein O2931_10185 [Planctomycetota bacterium]|nr:hypothetical protein [Planctomycetota bacterium]MDA1179150.1 hypothetical protein [Planctomycetota bacterium]
MVRLSIVIPAVTTNEALESSLVSVLENRPTGCEIIVPNRGTYRDPYDLTDEVCFVESSPSASVVACIHAGIRAARGSTIHLLMPGTLAEPNWCEDAIDRLQSDLSIASVSPQLQVRTAKQAVLGVTLGTGGGRKLIRSRQSLRTAEAIGWGPTLMAGFYRRSALQAVGGWDLKLHTAADCDLAVRLAEHGFGCESSQARVAADAAELPGSVYRRAADAERCFGRHRRGGHRGLSITAHGISCVTRWLQQLHHPWTWIADGAGMASVWCGLSEFQDSLSLANTTAVGLDVETGTRDAVGDESDEHLLPYPPATKKNYDRRRSA